MIKKALLVSFLAIASIANAQKVVVIRQSVNSGIVGGISVFVDDKLMCKNLNNNRHVEFTLTPGKHIFIVQFSGPNVKEKAKKEAIDIEMESGKTYYVAVNYQIKGLVGNIYPIEITENSARKILQASTLDNSCF